MKPVSQLQVRESYEETENKSGFQLSGESNSRFLRFCITSLCDWLTKLEPLFQPMGSQTKTNRHLLALVFPRLAPVA